LHIPPSIGDQIGSDLLPDDTIDQAMGLVFQVALGVLGENDLKSHQPSFVTVRILLTTSARGFTRPCATCWFPSANIFSKAQSGLN